MFSTGSELTPRAPIPDGRMERFMHPWSQGPVMKMIMMMMMMMVVVLVVVMVVVRRDT